MLKKTKNYLFEADITNVILNNGKKGRSLLIQITSGKTNSIYFLQMDRCLWWLPTIIKDNSDKFRGISIGWLFLQVGRLKYI